ncbi:hypothetical protein BO71DRAFT_443541 [Aspergillus ellipticus CBS 707.79]|uniref:Transcription factor domain-containing protein n=1 Tax=Aspergillus ellipticus CBS 707.79 TaxID=1448320 RepID=A0A319D8T8_9EURO|nr:hypothetical protein BO71DRAFT_443541 [Aspergillus ellipticus CBS 707.79]
MPLRGTHALPPSGPLDGSPLRSLFKESEYVLAQDLALLEATPYPAHLTALVNKHGPQLVSMTESFLSTCQKWLAIIHKDIFRKCINDQSINVSRDLITLLLAMGMITRPLMNGDNPDSLRQLMYETVRRLFWDKESVARPSLSLIQAGLLLSVYEYGHGLLDASFITISICSSMAQTVRFCNTAHLPLPRPGALASESEMLHTCAFFHLHHFRLESTSPSTPTPTSTPDQSCFTPQDKAESAQAIKTIVTVISDISGNLIQGQPPEEVARLVEPFPCTITMMYQLLLEMRGQRDREARVDVSQMAGAFGDKMAMIRFVLENQSLRWRISSQYIAQLDGMTVGSLQPLVDFDMIKRFQVPLPFLVGFAQDTTKRLQNAIPRNVEVVAITDDLALQNMDHTNYQNWPVYEFMDHAIIDLVRSWLDDWRMASWMLLISSLWLIIGLMANQAASDITEDFDLPGGQGNRNQHTAKLGNYMTDATTLVNGMYDAMVAATSKDKSEARMVAQKLFTAYFGVQFMTLDGERGEVGGRLIRLSADTVYYLHTFVNAGDYTALVHPPNLFCNSYGQMFTWDDAVFDASGDQVEVDGQIQSIRDLYEPEYTAAPERRPYLIPDLRNYAFLDDKYDKDICSTNLLMGMSAPGHQKRVELDEASSHPASSASGSNEAQVTERVLYEALQDSILICPNVLNGKYNRYAYLSDVPYVQAGSAIKLPDLLTESSTMLHELVHLVTFWRAADLKSGQRWLRATDIKYALAACLELANSNAFADTSLNVKNYTFFAMAWWYCDQEWNG